MGDLFNVINSFPDELKFSHTRTVSTQGLSQSYFVHPLDFPSSLYWSQFFCHEQFHLFLLASECLDAATFCGKTISKIPGHSTSLKSIKVFQKIGVHLHRHHVINRSGKITGRGKDLGGVKIWEELACSHESGRSHQQAGKCGSRAST